jgi:hypothetical protein
MRFRQTSSILVTLAVFKTNEKPNQVQMVTTRKFIMSAGRGRFGWYGKH